MRVREFVIGDYEQVRALWVAVGFEMRPGDDYKGISVKLSKDSELFLVAEEQGRIVGTVMGAWDGRRGWIYHLGVLPGNRRAGVATALVHELESRMRRLGVPKVNALIYPSNKVSSRFFCSMGYAVTEMKEAGKVLDG